MNKIVGCFVGACIKHYLMIIYLLPVFTVVFYVTILFFLLLPFRMKYTFLINAFIGMCTKKITLCLYQVHRKASAEVGIIISQRAPHARYWNLSLYGCGNYIANA